MPFQLSPGVAVVEKDFSSIIPAVATSTGAFAGAFQWGPVNEPVTVSSENVLVQRFGKPSDANAQSFFTAANFLSYANNLLVARTDTTGARNAVATQSGTVTGVTFSNNGTGYASAAAAPTVSFSAPDIDGGIQATGTAVLSGGSITAIVVGSQGSTYATAPQVHIPAPTQTGGVQATAHAVLTANAVTSIVIDTAGSGYVGTVNATLSGGGGSGASLNAATLSTSSIASVTITNHGTGYTTTPSVTFTGGTGSNAAATSTISVGGVKINNTSHYLTDFADGEGVVGEFAAKYPGSLGNSITVYMADSESYTDWAYKTNFDGAPGTSDYAARTGATNDELHILIVDTMGSWTGTAGAILEKFAFVSKASDAKKSDGTNNYYKDVINSRSQYIWWMDHVASTSNWGTVAGTTSFDTLMTAYDVDLSGGTDDLAATDGNLMNSWAIFSDDTQYDIRLIPLGKASATVANFVISNIAEVRLDCVVFASPEDVDTGDIIIASGNTATDKIIAYRNALPSSSYASMDSGFKYQYDRYNDKYRWVPLNGDVAGLCARVDYQADPWFSPGGLNRGQIKNVVKLAVNPNQTDRDNLYKAGVNPVVTFPGQGTVLYGDKTLLAKPSAFDRINVRRLFIVLEKAIATAAKFQLFEFNDSFTQAQFRNLVEPFLRDVQGRRGITEFVVKCDGTNNTPQIVDSNQFVADIYVKPNRSINFITLNFIAARSSISFSEIGGGV
jgi:phage tail sheath protein FI